MTWARLDDGFRDHPRFIDMSCGAVGLWASSLAYANKHLTDGHIAAAVVAKLAPKETSQQRKRLIDELLARGVWSANGDGSYAIRDYLQWNDSKEEVTKRRDASKKAAKTRWDAKGNATRIADGNALRPNQPNQPNHSAGGIKPPAQSRIQRHGSEGGVKPVAPVAALPTGNAEPASSPEPADDGIVDDDYATRAADLLATLTTAKRVP